jgi:hypothetical protein
VINCKTQWDELLLLAPVWQLARVICSYKRWSPAPA